MIGFEHACGAIIVSLPAYLQVAGSEIGKLMTALDTADIAVGYREPRAGGWFQSLRRNAFHGLLRFVTRLQFRDLGCNARAFKRKILDEIHLYGDQDRFLPVLAERQGFRVAEVPFARHGSPAPGGLQTAQLFARFPRHIYRVFSGALHQKPLRFFGMVGLVILSVGVLELAYLIFERVYFHSPLADRPALLLAALFIVLGVQIFALGLLGELIIFTHAADPKIIKSIE